MDEYDEGLICALSGVTPSDEEMPTAYMGDSDNDAPVGWIQVTLTRKLYNPNWVAVQETKEALTANLLSQVEDPVAREASADGIRIQVEAQFAALELKPEFAPTITESFVRYLAPVEYAEGLGPARNELLEKLGLEDSGWLAEEGEDAEAPGIVEDDDTAE